MDAAAMDRIERSFKLVAPRGAELVDRFYAHLFARYPTLRALFPTDMAAQKSKLLSAIGTVVNSIRSPERFEPVLIEMGCRHADYGAQADHYAAVRDTLLDV